MRSHELVPSFNLSSWKNEATTRCDRSICKTSRFEDHELRIHYFWYGKPEMPLEAQVKIVIDSYIYQDVARRIIRIELQVRALLEQM